MTTASSFTNPKKLIMGIVFVFVAIVVINTVSAYVPAVADLQSGFGPQS